jgi:hypothetical protein
MVATFYPVTASLGLRNGMGPYMAVSLGAAAKVELPPSFVQRHGRGVR